ncbi:GNAT family N-acetyltransferase [Arthrobacter sp. ov407]|uniref:GNAT family N-acetyltransferase n=1 Tax=Arthrobacter sp. ov407 TaxID=1761748 RepID=UPI00115FCE96|nr:GNAT family N-acetyltransferase [Arthrobacter sp. ov407]
MLTGQGNYLVIEPATVADADRFAADAPWARADEWRPAGSSLVAKIKGEPAGIVVSATNRVHPTRDPAFVFVAEPFRRRGIGSALVKSIQTRRSMPLSVKAHPGTLTHEFYKSLGAVRYQVCPPERIDTSSVEVRRWALENRREDIRSGDRLSLEQLTEAWTELYEIVHAPWSPTGTRSGLLAEFGPMIQTELDPSRSVFVVRNDRVAAACFVFGTDGDPDVEAICESLDPANRLARADVAACMAEVLVNAGGTPVLFDGHITDPQFFPTLQRIPGVTGKELELLEIPAPGPPVREQ